MPIDFNSQRTWGPIPRYERVKAYKRKDTGFIFISGPCSVESEFQIYKMAKFLASCGVTHLRGGVYRAGTYPGDNYGLVDISLIKAFHDAAKINGLKNIIELLDIRLYTTLYDYADCFQVGARQMQNYSLLRLLADSNKQVFLKRNTGSTLDEFLGAAEHLLVHGSCDPVLIERGSSTHLNHVRWDLSISMIPSVKLITQIPIICDPSHGTGRRDLVEPMALAGVVAGADGLLVEVHDDPEKSLSDKEQAITPQQFINLVNKVRKVKSVL